MSQHNSINDCIEHLEFFTKNGGDATTYKLLHNIHYWLLIAIEEHILCGQIDQDYGAISPSDTTALRMCGDFGARLYAERSHRLPAAALTSLRAAAELLELEPQNAMAADAVLQTLRFTTEAFGGERMKARARSPDDPAESALLQTRTTLSGALMTGIYSRLVSLAATNEAAGCGMEVDAVATVLAITDATIGMLCAIRDALFTEELDANAFKQELEDYAASDRLEAGGRQAAATMESALAAVLQAWAAMAETPNCLRGPSLATASRPAHET